MGNSLVSRSATHADLIKAANVLIEQLPGVLGATPIPTGGTTMTPAQYVTLLENFVTVLELSDSLRAKLHNAVVAVDTALAAVRAAVRDLRNFVQARYGANSDQYAALGFTPPKKAVKTPAVKAAAAVKGKATREARGTKGKNQKKGIHGTVAATDAPTTKR